VEVRRRRVTRHVEEPSLQLVQRAAAEAILGRAIVRHCLIAASSLEIGKDLVKVSSGERGEYGADAVVQR
jgi:hypothetical protein